MFNEKTFRQLQSCFKSTYEYEIWIEYEFASFELPQLLIEAKFVRLECETLQYRIIWKINMQNIIGAHICKFVCMVDANKYNYARMYMDVAGLQL